MNLLEIIFDLIIYYLGFALFVAAQARNSIASSSNGLEGWQGVKEWLRLQSITLATSAFFAGILYGTIVQLANTQLRAVGLSLHAEAVAGIAGYTANAALYQILGLIPAIRQEVPRLVPPPELRQSMQSGGEGKPE